ncbi:hypothetical protein SAMN05216275_102281 [Streptosporangium canum]|uniref:Uncharacterized protein n=1 Tax=Streptosporangium canum TaxID=324952 RepID=A0A1I3GYY2_9ACTN|nr:hypothetical protein [Streptosporangium canum]SFI28591.1 hypothetical protein SAMN05216275_102281 [Streptosporangium canum]
MFDVLGAEIGRLITASVFGLTVAAVASLVPMLVAGITIPRRQRGLAHAGRRHRPGPLRPQGVEPVEEIWEPLAGALAPLPGGEG